MMSRLLTAVALLLPMVSVALTDGWTLPPRTIVRPDDAKAWIAAIGKGEEAFAVSRLSGAEGDVVFEGDAIRVVKRNDRGMIRIMSRQPFPVMGNCTRIRASAEVESSVDEPMAAEGYVRIGPMGRWGGIDRYDYKADGRALSGKQKLDKLISTPVGRPQLKAAHYERTGKGDTNLLHVCIYVSGGPSVSVWRNVRADPVPEVRKANCAVRPKRTLSGRNFATNMVDREVFHRGISASAEHCAKVVKDGEFARLTVDGKPVPPILFKGGGVADDRVAFCGKRMHEAGIPLLVASVRFGATPRQEGSWTTNGFDAAKAVAQVEKAMRTAPDALYLLTVRLDAPVGYCDGRTNEIWRTDKGEIIYGNSVHVVGTKPDPNPKLVSWPWVSYHSRIWRKDVKDVLSAFVAELKRTGLSKRIVGVHIAGYHDAQFATAVPDWSEPARQAFAASGEADYVKFLKRSTMELQDDFAHHVRACFGKDIVVFRWCMSAFGGGFCSSHDIREFADSKEIDVIVPQPSYSYRSPGYAIGVKLPFASLHLNGKLLVHEHDLRTYAVWPADDSAVRDAGLSRAEDIDEWRIVDHKTAGQMIARRTGFWYYDMESGWYDEPEIAADIASIVRIAGWLQARPPTPWHPDAVFVIDEADLLDLQRGTGKNEMAKADINLYVERIAASGVPFDVCMKGDFDRHPEWAARYAYVLHYNRNTPMRSAAELNAEARAAGAYVPLPPNRVQVDMNGDFISVSCLKPGKYDFVLPRACVVVNLKSGLPEAVRGKVLSLELSAGETCWFALK